MHEHHRARFKEQLLKSGFEGAVSHQLLELLLFYSIPRVDTNPIAHRLFERFGSIKGIFSASFDELKSVEGIGENSALLIKLFPEMMKRYALESDGDVRHFDSVSTIAQYFCRLFIGVNHERLYMMLLNNRMNLIDCVLISEGTVNYSTANIGVMAQNALFKNASAVVLAHNHPNGHLKPSESDLALTEEMDKMLHTLQIPLLEHLIIVDDRFHPIMRHYSRVFKPSSVFQKMEDESFFSRFYDVDPSEWTAAPLFQ